MTPTATPSPTEAESVAFTLAPSATATASASATLSATSTPTVNRTLTAAVERTLTLAACNFDYAIVEQDPPDGEAGEYQRTNEPYTRLITFLNTGTCPWLPNTSLAFVEGENFNAEPRIWIRQTVDPGATTVLTFEGTMPARGARDPISGTWQLKTPEQINIGAPLIISVLVFDPGIGQ
jgi:hypothetical protein